MSWLIASSRVFCVTHAGSSEALLSGQKPPFMLLVRAYNKVDNTRALHIRNGTSEYFVVSPPASSLIGS